ncbi:MAG TPA: nitrophenyl compound nitroreductase subunit ArsF family protein [Candidatus Omnitrophota bacterium]|nr:nitrophenyl compound nitroreductase subunit ArsF family protein [Candidatus Omnitrophota bacterium]
MKNKTCQTVSVLLAAVSLASSLFFGTTLAMGGSSRADISTRADVVAPLQGDQIVVYYFHGTFRCSTCNKMERHSREAIERAFKDELASGKLVFKSVNVESKGNEHFVNDYQLYTKALILSSVKDGKEIRSKNLDKIWQLVRNREQYENYVRDEVSAFLREA